MILFDKILSELIGTVGWRQSTVTGDVVVDAANLSSSSGLYVQGAHAGITVGRIKATQEDKSISDANMNTVLANLIKDGISNVLNYIFPNDNAFQNDLLFKNESDFSTKLTTIKGFVGFEITVANRNDIVSILNKSIIQFDGSGTVKLLLFNTGVKLPVVSKSITVTADTNIVSALDWVLGYITAAGGKYYLGYLNSALTISAYDRTFGNSNIMTPFNSILFKPVYVTDWNVETLFDINNLVYSAESWGLNFDVTTAPDYTNVVLQNKDRFAKAIQLSAACEALALMTTTQRINPEERVIMNVLGQKVLIDSPASYNLYSSLEKEMKALQSIFIKPQIKTGTLR